MSSFLVTRHNDNKAINNVPLPYLRSGLVHHPSTTHNLQSSGQNTVRLPGQTNTSVVPQELCYLTFVKHLDMKWVHWSRRARRISAI